MGLGNILRRSKQLALGQELEVVRSTMPPTGQIQQVIIVKLNYRKLKTKCEKLMNMLI